MYSPDPAVSYGCGTLDLDFEIYIYYVAFYLTFGTEGFWYKICYAVECQEHQNQ